MIKKISHIGIAVKSIEEAAKFYEKIGLKIESIEEVPTQKLRVAFIPVGEAKIELLEPTSEESAVAKFIEKKGEGIQHIAFDVDDLSEALANNEKEGIQMIDKEPRPGAGGNEIAFLHPKSAFGVLYEFCKKKQ
ncbi:MAG: methylmalonyl-CoA epimerase [Candidatus Cloacimonetes bacterium]|nr:methylmalonyl-CoA epimerase [Candidatus Cloacimonadota bacterium]